MLVLDQFEADQCNGIAEHCDASAISLGPAVQTVQLDSQTGVQSLVPVNLSALAHLVPVGGQPSVHLVGVSAVSLSVWESQMETEECFPRAASYRKVYSLSPVSFLGVGAPPDDPTWGGMLAVAGNNFIEVSPWLLLFPGLIICVAVFSVNALRDVRDPRLRGAK